MIRRSISILVLSAAAAPALAQISPATRAAGGPQPLSRSVFVQRIDAAFVASDANKDGFADRAELSAAQSRQATQAKAQSIRAREAAFRRLDANKDGSLSLQEFNAVAVASPLPAPNVAPVLARFDANKDGKIGLTENRAPAIANFDRADANKDGVLSVQEQRASRRR